MNNENSLLLAVLLREACRVRVRAGLGNDLPHDQAAIAWLKGRKGIFSSLTDTLLGDWASNSIKELIDKGTALAIGGSQPPVETGAELLSPLLSIFSTVSLTPVTKEKRFHRLDDDPDALTFPVPSDECWPSREQYARRWQAFEQDLNTVQDALTLDTLLLLMEKHFSVVPAFPTPVTASCEACTALSLYDYAKTAVALIGALLRNAAEKQSGDVPFLLIGGDLSGVQDFVYSIPSRGALKTLRGRSFFLELLVHHVVEELLGGLELSRAHIIFAGGGGFRLLAQNTSFARQVYTRLLKRINSHLLKKFDGRLALCLEAEILSEEDLRSELSAPHPLTERWRDLSKSLDRAKEKKFSTELSSLLQPQHLRGRECGTCHRFLPRLRKDGSCFDCYAFKDIGGRLARLLTPSLSCWSQPPRLLSSSKRKYLPYIYLPGLKSRSYYSVPKENEQALPPSARFVLNSSAATDYTDPKHKRLLIAHYAQRVDKLPVYAQLNLEAQETRDTTQNAQDGTGPDPLQEELEVAETPDNIAEFTDLARAACGRQLLAAMRLDADNAGMLISEGLKEAPDLASVGALCRQLNQFFTRYLDYICQGDLSAWAGKVTPCRIADENSTALRSVVIVYSGGEDLFLVGAWSEVVEVAFEMQQAYKLFTAENPDMDLSAGITLHKPKFPVYQMARLSGEALSIAKAHQRDCGKAVREQCRAAEECLFFRQDPNTYQISCVARKGAVSPFYTPALATHNEQIHAEMIEKKLPDRDRIDRIALALSWSEARNVILRIAQFFVQAAGTRQADRVVFLFPTASLQRLSDLVEIWRREGALYLPWLQTCWRTMQRELATPATSAELRKEFNDIRNLIEEYPAALHLSLNWLNSLRRREGENSADTGIL